MLASFKLKVLQKADEYGSTNTTSDSCWCLRKYTFVNLTVSFSDWSRQRTLRRTEEIWWSSLSKSSTPSLAPPKGKLWSGKTIISKHPLCSPTEDDGSCL